MRNPQVLHLIPTIQKGSDFALYPISGVALYGIVDLLFFRLAKAISTENWMHMNAISMALGLGVGATRSIYLIRKQVRKLKD